MELKEFDYYTLDSSNKIVKYKGYVTTSYYAQRYLKHGIAVNYDIFDALEKNKSSLLQDIKVPQHSAIVPCTPLPFASAELIQKFTIKRKADAGDYNIFGDFTSVGMLTQSHRIYEDRKVIFMDWDTDTTGAMAAEAGIYDKPTCIKSDTAVCISDPKGSWHSLLEGKYTKPCVSYKNLDMSAVNPVTLDLLRIVLESAKSGNKFDFHTKLAMLNNYDWRAIPETMLLFRHILREGTHLGNYTYKHLSYLTKPSFAVLKGILSQPSSDADLALGRELINAWCEVDFHNEMFVKSSSLYDCLDKHHISVMCFEKFYNCTTRIRTI